MSADPLDPFVPRTTRSQTAKATKPAVQEMKKAKMLEISELPPPKDEMLSGGRCTEIEGLTDPRSLARKVGNSPPISKPTDAVVVASSSDNLDDNWIPSSVEVKAPARDNNGMSNAPAAVAVPQVIQKSIPASSSGGNGDDDWGNDTSYAVMKTATAVTSCGDDWDKNWSDSPISKTMGRGESINRAPNQTESWSKTPNGGSTDWDTPATAIKAPPQSKPQTATTIAKPSSNDDWDAPAATKPTSQPQSQGPAPATISSDDWDTSPAVSRAIPQQAQRAPTTAAWDDWNTPASTSQQTTTTPAKSSWDDWGDTGVSTPGSTEPNKSNGDSWGEGNITREKDVWGNPLPSNDSWGGGGSRGGLSRGGGRGGGRGNGRGGGRGGRGNGRGGGRGGDRAPREGDWPCSDCGATNFSRRTECFKCNAEKPADAGDGSAGIGRGGGRRSGSWNTKGGPTNANNEPLGGGGGGDDWSSWSSPICKPGSACNDDGWGETASRNKASPSLVSVSGSVLSQGDGKHGKKDKKSKSKKHRRQSTSSSTSSSSSSSSSDDRRSKKRRKYKKHKHSKRSRRHEECRHLSPEAYHDVSLAPGFGNFPSRVKKFQDYRIEIKVTTRDTATQTPKFPDMDDSTINLKEVEAYETSLPLSYRFAAISQCEAGGVGVLGTIIQSTKVATALDGLDSRRITVKSGIMINAPKTRDKVNSLWPEFSVTLKCEESQNHKKMETGTGDAPVVPAMEIDEPDRKEDELRDVKEDSGGESRPVVEDTKEIAGNNSSGVEENEKILEIRSPEREETDKVVGNVSPGVEENEKLVEN